MAEIGLPQARTTGTTRELVPPFHERGFFFDTRDEPISIARSRSVRSSAFPKIVPRSSPPTCRRRMMGSLWSRLPLSISRCRAGAWYS